MMITVVTDNDERTFKAHSWNVRDDMRLTVFDGEQVVADYAPGGWQYVLRTGSEIPDQDSPSTTAGPGASPSG